MFKNQACAVGFVGECPRWTDRWLVHNRRCGCERSECTVGKLNPIGIHTEPERISRSSVASSQNGFRVERTGSVLSDTVQLGYCSEQ